MINECPYCKKPIDNDEVLRIQYKRNIKRSGERIDSFPMVEFREYGCPHCGGIFFDPKDVYEDILKNKLKVEIMK